MANQTTPVIQIQEGKVGIGEVNPSAKLHVSGTNDVALIQGSGSTLFSVEGTQGQLFSVTDSLSGSLFAISDISGIPILEVESNDAVTMGTFGANTLVVTGSRVGIGTADPSYPLHVYGNGSARFMVSSDVGVLGSTDFFIPQGRKLLLDGAGGHTFIEEESDSNLKFYVAGSERLNITNTSSTFAGDVQATGLYVGSTNASFDFYNNGTSYLNGAVTIDDVLTVNRVDTTGINNNVAGGTVFQRQFYLSTGDAGGSFLLGKIEHSTNTNGAISGVCTFAYDYGSQTNNCTLRFNFAQRSGNARGTWWYEGDDQESATDRVHVRLIDDGSGDMYVWATCVDFAIVLVETNNRSAVLVPNSGTLTAATLSSGTTLFDTANDPTAEMHVGNVYAHGIVTATGDIIGQGKLTIANTSSIQADHINLGTAAGSNFLYLQGMNDTDKVYLNSHHAGVLDIHAQTATNFMSGSNTIMTISGSGNVGIGTVSPGTKFHLHGGEAHITNAADGGYTALRLMNQKTYGAGTGTNEKVRFVMGISEAGGALSGREGFVIEAGIASETDSSNAIIDFKVRDGGAIGTYQTVNGANKSVIFAGNIGLGGATNPTRLLHIDNTANTTKASAYFYTNGSHTGQGSSAHVAIWSDNAASTGTLIYARGDGSGHLLILNKGGTDKFVVTDDGDMTARVGSFKSIDASNSTLMNLMANDGSNAATFRTTATGKIFIIKSQNSGTLKFDSTISNFTGNITLADNKAIKFGADDDLVIYHDTTNGLITNYLGNLNIQNDENDGDILFIGRDGNTAITAMQIDMSAGGNVGIGTTIPDSKLHLNSSSGDTILTIEADDDNNNENDNPIIHFKQDGGGLKGKIGLNGDANSTFTGAGANSMYLGTSGNTLTHLIQNDAPVITLSGSNAGIGTTNTKVTTGMYPKLDVVGGITHTAIRRKPIAYSASPASGGSGYYALLATFNISGENNSDLCAVYTVTAEETTAVGCYARIMIKLRKGTSDTTLTCSSLSILDIDGNVSDFGAMSGTSNAEMLEEDSFILKVISASDIRLYIRKKTTFGQIHLFEDALSYENNLDSNDTTQITYYENAAWISSLPMTAGNTLTSYMAATRVMHQFGFFTTTTSLRYLSLYSGFLSGTPSYNQRYVVPKPGKLIGMSIQANNSRSNNTLRVYDADSPTSYSQMTSATFSVTANRNTWVPFNLGLNMNGSALGDDNAIAFGIQCSSSSTTNWNAVAVFQF